MAAAAPLGMPSGTSPCVAGSHCRDPPAIVSQAGLQARAGSPDLKAALLAEARARGLTDRACDRRNWHGARATSSVDGWASMALRSHVVEAAGVRSSERRRAWADSSKRASLPDAEPPPSARWSTHYSPRAPVSLTRRLRRTVAVWPEEPGLTPAPTLLRRCHLLLHGHRAASPGAASLGAAPRAVPPCAAPPAPSLRSAACAALPLPPTPAPRRLTPRCRARRCLARLRLAPRRLAREAVSPHRAGPPPCEDITKCSLYTLVCVHTGPLPAAYR